MFWLLVFVVVELSPVKIVKEKKEERNEITLIHADTDLNTL